jgi:hypothetical protein
VLLLLLQSLQPTVQSRGADAGAQLVVAVEWSNLIAELLTSYGTSRSSN